MDLQTFGRYQRDQFEGGQGGGAQAGRTAGTQIWSPMRKPLAAYLAQYPDQFASYFLESYRLTREDYFWVLMDLIQDASSGGALIDALTRPQGTESQWVSLLDTILAALPTKGDAKLPPNAHATLQLMAELAAARPSWLSAAPAILQRVGKLWAHPGRIARLANARGMGVPERAESALLARLLVEHVRGDLEQLPRLLQVFTLFDHQVRGCSVCSARFCARPPS